MLTLNSHTHCQVAQADSQTKTWQRVCLFQPLKPRRRKNTEPLTSHHGQKELIELWNQIKNSPYVKEGISIEWGGNTFYKNPQKDGKIDIVHLKSDKRYVLQVQTTGRNLRETKAIAEKLKEQYE